MEHSIGASPDKSIECSSSMELDLELSTNPLAKDLSLEDRLLGAAAEDDDEDEDSPPPPPSTTLTPSSNLTTRSNLV